MLEGIKIYRVYVYIHIQDNIMKRRSQANVSDDTDDSDNESIDVESSNTPQVPIPGHQSLCEYDSEEFNVNHVIEDIKEREYNWGPEKRPH